MQHSHSLPTSPSSPLFSPSLSLPPTHLPRSAYISLHPLFPALVHPLHPPYPLSDLLGPIASKALTQADMERALGEHIERIDMEQVGGAGCCWWCVSRVFYMSDCKKLSFMSRYGW